MNPLLLRSRWHIPIRWDAPSGTLSRGQRLLIQAGYIRRQSPGTYAYLPLGQRVLENLSAVVDTRMQSIGGLKMSVPILQPRAMWETTDRWSAIGPELFRVRDRHGADHCLAPTAEEVMTSIAAADLLSPRQLPLRLYQITPKFRDEVRPRSGLLRGREFLMKDMYSFDATPDLAMTSYTAVLGAYHGLMADLSLPYEVSEAGTGAIGGTVSHEFHVVGQGIGEDVLFRCSCRKGTYVANAEVARALAAPFDGVVAPISDAPPLPITADQLQNVLKDIGLAVTYVVCQDDAYMIAVTHASRVINPYALQRLSGTQRAVVTSGGLPVSYDQRTRPTAILVDQDVAASHPDWATWLESIGPTRVAPIRDIATGDRCPVHAEQSELRAMDGIEVAHLFFLGTRYAEPLRAHIRGETVQMGCYGVGISRLMAATAEALSDADGLIWPHRIAPFVLAVVPAPAEGANENAIRVAQRLAAHPKLANRVVFDDRAEPRFGAKIREAKFIGASYALIVSGDANEKLQLEGRRGTRKDFLTFDEVLGVVVHQTR